jgi:molybdopterin molybdotransferase
MDEARGIILAHLSVLGEEAVPLGAAAGRILAADLYAEDDVVPFARSAMDGFALRASDTRQASLEHPIDLPLSGNAYAEAGARELAAGTAMAISTGAAVPAGADAVIPIEDVESSSHSVRILAPVARGDCIFPPAEDVRRGELLLRRGERIEPRVIALLAMAGKAKVPVFHRPRVSILSTGNELVELDSQPRYGQIRNSNAPSLAALAASCGATTSIAGIVPDEPAKLGARLEAAREGADLLVTTGGASRGARDYVKHALAELGAELKFSNVAVRPGRPCGFAMWRGVPVCILPGNPAAVFVCFHLFVAPAIRKLAGLEQIGAPRARARVRGQVHGRAGVDYVVFARARLDGSGFEVEALPNQCSALVRTSAAANALMFVPAEGGVGKSAEIEILDWSDVALSAGSGSDRKPTPRKPNAATASVGRARARR